MTSLVDNNIDELIARTRLHDAVSDMTFLTAYTPRDLMNPIDRYITAVEDTEVKQSQVFIGDDVGRGVKGRLYDVTLRLRVYAPHNSAVFALLRKSSLLADALEASDTEGAITGISLGGVAYENAARTVYRDLTLRLSFLLCGEGSR